jgi:hypothetical protein
MKGSAEGAKYKSQGQARSASPLVTKLKFNGPALKGRNNYFGLSGLWGFFCVVNQGRRPDEVGTCPWLLYSAPSALELNLPAYSALS